MRHDVWKLLDSGDMMFPRPAGFQSGSILSTYQPAEIWAELVKLEPRQKAKADSHGRLWSNFVIPNLTRM